jgi:hypothetical protein
MSMRRASKGLSDLHLASPVYELTYFKVNKSALAYSTPCFAEREPR